jgi:hypothetical protein
LVLASNSVGNSELKDSSVATAELSDLAVTNAKIANNSIDSNKIIDGSITTADMTSSVASAITRVGNTATTLLLGGTPGTVTACFKTNDIYTLDSANVFTGSNNILEMLFEVFECSTWIANTQTPYLTLTGTTSGCFEPDNDLAVCFNGLR